MYWSPNLLAVFFKKQEISQQVVTRMQDLASEFSKNFPGVISPEPHSGRGDLLPHPTPSLAFGRARGASASVLGPKPRSPLTFQPWLRPWVTLSELHPIIWCQRTSSMMYVHV